MTKTVKNQIEESELQTIGEIVPDFNDRLGEIKGIYLNMIDEYDNYCVRMEFHQNRIKVYDLSAPLNAKEPYSVPKIEFVKNLSALGIDKWLPVYCRKPDEKRVSISLWRVAISFNERKNLNIYGNYDCPDNFNNFLALLGYDASEKARLERKSRMNAVYIDQFREICEAETPDELQTEIRRLKRRIGKLKRDLETPFFVALAKPEKKADTDARLQLDVAEKCLELAKEALNSNGGNYVLTKNDLRALDFDKNIENIDQIDFRIGGFGYSGDRRCFTFHKDRVTCDENVDADIQAIAPYDLDRDDFIEKIRSLKLGEWDSTYDPRKYNTFVMDGTQWQLTVTYSNGKKPFTAYGDNVFPYNFKDFLWATGFDEDYSVY